MRSGFAAAIGSVKRQLSPRSSQVEMDRSLPSSRASTDKFSRRVRTTPKLDVCHSGRRPASFYVACPSWAWTGSPSEVELRV